METESKAAAFKIDESKRQSWLSLAAVWTGAMVCVPCLMVGGYLAMGFPVGSIVVCVLIGYAIICAYMCFMGMQGADTGLPTAPMSTNALGETGARYIISTILAVACIGWFGVQSAVCGESFSVMMSQMTGLDIPAWVSTIFWGAVMLLTAAFGYNGVKYLNYVAIPALVLVLGYAAFATLFKNDGVTIISNYKPEQPMTVVAGINLVVATFAVGGVISADFSRYAKNRADVVKSTVIGVFPAGLVVLLLGATASIVAGDYDITAVLSKLGLPAFRLLALVLATWTTNVGNAYSGGLALTNLLGFSEKRFKVTTAIAGGVGTLLGALGIMTQFQNFLSILTSFVPPVAGVIIAAYWIAGKGRKENFTFTKGVNVAGVVAFGLGAATAYVTANVFPFFVGPINGIVVSMALYVILIKLVPVKAEQIQEI